MKLRAHFFPQQFQSVITTKKVIASALVCISFMVMPTSVASASGRLIAAPINTVLNGTGAPASTLGANGDFYIDKKSFNIYGPKANGRWPLPVSLKGPVGTMGPIGLSGKVVTASGGVITGERGATGPKGETGTAGPAGLNGTNGLNGATGLTGAGANGSSGGGSAGPAGPAGPAGSNGAAGATGATGAVGAPGAQGPQGLAGATGATGATGASGSSSIQVDNLAAAGGGTWTISSSSPAKSASAAFGNLAINSSYAFTIYLTDRLTGLIDNTAASSAEVTGDVSDTVQFNAQYSYAKVSSPSYSNAFTISEVITGTVVTGATPATNLTVAFIDGTGWSGFNANVLSGRAYIQQVGSVS
jgi:Collagen triple helix repeat (20 copies)